MAEDASKLADELEVALDDLNDPKLRQLFNGTSKDALSAALHECRSRNLTRLNESGRAAGSVPLDVSWFQRREQDLAVLRSLLGQ